MAMTDKELIDKLRHDATFNPWLNKVDEFRQGLATGIRQFVLDCNKIDEYNVRINGGPAKFCLKLEIPPQPFIGTPEANIWLLLKNPGYSDIDLYDCWGDIVQDSIVLPADVAKNALQRRQELMISQFGFDQEKGKEFYLLDESFRTCIASGKGGYGWYSRYLFPEDGLLSKFCENTTADRLAFCSRNIFVLDYHPYHSKNFCEAHSDVLVHEYWKVLVEHGLKSKKIMVFWGSKILAKVRQRFPQEYASAVNERRVFVLKGARAYFSSESLYQVADSNGEFLKPYIQV